MQLPTAAQLKLATERLSNCFYRCVTTQPADRVLQACERLWVSQQVQAGDQEMVEALQVILEANQALEFQQTLKRICFILVNNWEMARNYPAVYKLVNLLGQPLPRMSSNLPHSLRLQAWVEQFANSSDYRELEVYANRYYERPANHWSRDYSYYFFVHQSLNQENSLEQRQMAKRRSQQLKEQFRRNLAFYLAHSQSYWRTATKYHNPTQLNDHVLILIQKILNRRGNFSYTNLARIFVQQTQQQTYSEFKQSFLQYLNFSLESSEAAILNSSPFSEKLQSLYLNANDQVLDQTLLLRTCNRVIDYLTVESGSLPSSLFIQLISGRSPLNLVILLLKILFICPASKLHLERQMSQLIDYYQEVPKEKCQWLINFVEILQVALAIYTEKIKYDLINNGSIYATSASRVNRVDCRVLSQTC